MHYLNTALHKFIKRAWDEYERIIFNFLPIIVKTSVFLLDTDQYR